MTNATITGSLMWPPALRFTVSGKAVCSFSLDFDGKHGIDCEAWEELGERIANRDLQPGQYIQVTGYYKWRTWEDKNGNHRKRIFVVKSGKPLSISQGTLFRLNYEHVEETE